MLAYNICFIRRSDEILLLNRNKPSWMGRWNGVGGKVENGETPRASVLREVYEETGIRLDTVRFKGIVTWLVDGRHYGGMYLYTAELEAAYPYETPIKTEEGILDWKKIEWILDPNNEGVASNLPRFIPLMLQEDGCYDHHCLFMNGAMTGVVSRPIAAATETDAALLAGAREKAELTP
ncbi:NUDIX hydrolase [Paenibacillus validus]|uniref:NUDIX domain-containing protein n=1 Tax=Paenibacillus validus TaxID=44253 RepID=A0A7X2Z8W9_9BACL|nr:8-oxo-dGTP diphosphatase [Paenibacillus validus]MUG70412.1 NUDIX domain-containing protein [Paenibacillus validus]